MDDIKLQVNHKKHEKQKTSSLDTIPLQKEPLGNEQNVLSRIELSKNSIAENLKLLLGHYKEIGEKEVALHGHNPQKQAKIKQFLNELNNDKKQRKMRLRELSKIETSREKQQKQRKIEENFRIEQRKRKMMKRMEKSADDRKQHEQERAKNKEQWKKFFVEFKKQQPLYERNNIEYLKRLQQQQKQLEAKIEAVKIRHQSIELDEIKQHIEKHKLNLEQLLRQKRETREALQVRIQQQNDQFFPHLYKPEARSILKVEKRQKSLKKKEPYDRMNRIKKYQDIVRDYYMPEVPQLEQRPEPMNMKKRYRYLNGISYGEAYDVEIKKLSEKEQKRLGNGYLRLLRTLPKKDNVSHSSEALSLKQKEEHHDRYQLGNSYLHSAPLRKNKSVDIPDNANRIELQNMINNLKNQNIFVQRKEQLLKFDRLPQCQVLQRRRQQIDEKLMESVEKKMELLEKLRSPDIINDNGKLIRVDQQ